MSYADTRDSLLKKILSADFSKREFSRCRLRVDVKGAVAHIRGRVPGPAQRDLVRNSAARVRGIHGVWDILALPGKKKTVVIDLGCGRKKQFAGTLGVDRQPSPAVNILADMEQTLPFADGSIDCLFAVHCLEHVRDLIGVMNEIHRVLNTGGIAHIMVPNYRCLNSVADPTHVRFFDSQTFKYFCLPRPGIRLFRPFLVSSTPDNIFADLSPVKEGEKKTGSDELALFFD